MKIRAKITEITYLSILCKDVGFHCFLDYSPHVSDDFTVRLYDGKWERHKEPIKASISSCSDDKMNLNYADRVIYQLKTILKKNKIDYSELCEVERIEIDYRF